MDENTEPTPQPRPRRTRRKRPNGRWTNPASPLQAARFARKLTGKEVITAIREICRGHGGEACRIDVAKLSDYETRNRRAGIDHIEAFCRFYKKSPEALGLIKWRDESDTLPDSGPETDLLTAYLTGHPAARLLASLTTNDSPLTYDTPVTELLAHILFEMTVLSAVTAHFLRASTEGDLFTADTRI